MEEKEISKYTTDEVMELIRQPLPEGEQKLRRKHEIVRINMHGSHSDTNEYKQRLVFLQSVEFKLQWLSHRQSNRRMFVLALLSSVIALVSAIITAVKQSTIY